MKIHLTVYTFILALLIMLHNSNAKAMKINDTVSVYFKLDHPELDTRAVKTIDSLLYRDIIHNQQKLLIVGYADYIGTNSYNDTLSTNRASSVRQYLISMGIPGDNVQLCIGKGEIPRAIELPEGYQSDRRVDIVTIFDSRKPSSKPKETPAPPTIIEDTQPVKIPEVSSIDAIKFNTEIEVNVDMLKVGQLLVLDRIFFYTGRHVIRTESIPELDKLYQLLVDNPDMVINIEGHVCCVHPAVDALDIDTLEVALSVNRAKALYYYLIRRGIDKSRLSYQGFGKRRPLRKHELTQEDQDLNKRVEIRIIEM